MLSLFLLIALVPASFAQFSAPGVPTCIVNCFNIKITEINNGTLVVPGVAPNSTLVPATLCSSGVFRPAMETCVSDNCSPADVTTAQGLFDPFCTGSASSTISPGNASRSRTTVLLRLTQPLSSGAASTALASASSSRSSASSLAASGSSVASSVVASASSVASSAAGAASSAASSALSVVSSAGSAASSAASSATAPPSSTASAATQSPASTTTTRSGAGHVKLDKNWLIGVFATIFATVAYSL